MYLRVEGHAPPPLIRSLRQEGRERRVWQGNASTSGGACTSSPHPKFKSREEERGGYGRAMHLRGEGHAPPPLIRSLRQGGRERRV